jgi:aromatic ring-opening dioxygenase LigB subunit
MSLLYACIAPHAGDLIQETADDPERVAPTRASMHQMGESLRALAPETVVIITPHGFRVPTALTVAIAEKAKARWSPDVKLDFDVDTEMASSIAERAEEFSVPLVRYIYGASGGPDCFIPLDWGAVVPLYFLAHGFEPKPRLVLVSPMRDLPHQLHYDFGRAIGQVLRDSPARCALIASADQAHAHNSDGPYGFDEAASKYDVWMQEVIRNGNLDDLLAADPVLVEAAKPDSLWPTLILAGALSENPLTPRLLSYEVNVYFGLMCAEFRVRPSAGS